ncbi:MAG TPA: hypothetical protein VK205_01760 [Prolixibacteraceae bacterium]|nr:hypothetical protein [Prolixibacteraceae bacterium]
MKQLRIFMILLAVVLATSCNKEEQATGVGDVLVVAKKSGAETVYGLSLYAYTFSTFSSVSAVSSANPPKTYTLKAMNGTFGYETPENAYSTTKPAAGTYTFTATFENGVQQVFENILLDAVLPIPTFEKCEFNKATQQLEIKWQLLNGATSYAINILDGSKTVFASQPLRNVSSPSFAIRSTRGGWAQNYVPEDGKTYTVRLFAYMYEPNGGSYNMQCVSMADSNVIWGN